MVSYQDAMQEAAVRGRTPVGCLLSLKEMPVRKRGEKVAVTAQQLELGADAMRQAREGHNPPSWAVDEDVWERARVAADKTYDEGDDAYWPAVVSIYQRMGGTIQGRTSKAALLSLADRDRAWDADAAVQRVRRWADAVDAPNAKYARAFLVIDGPEDNFTSYKYPIADVVDGELVAVPKALFAARVAASGGRGAKRNQAVLDAVDRYQEKLNGQVESKKSTSTWTPEMLKAEHGIPMSEFHRKLAAAVYSRWGRQGMVRDAYPEDQTLVVQVWDSDAFGSDFRLLSVPYELEDGEVYLGDVTEEVRETYEPVGKSMDGTVETRTVRQRRAFTALRGVDGAYVIHGLNGEARMLAKALEATSAREVSVVEQDGENAVRFLLPGHDEPEACVPATVYEEVDVPRARLLDGSRELRKAAEELGVVTLLVYEPDTVDGQGEYASEEDIREAAHAYIKRRVVKRNHSEAADGDELVESWTLDRDEWYGDRMIRKGAWLVRVKMGEKSRKLYKEGKINGASMGGYSCVA